jgi:hypothetical protein
VGIVGWVEKRNPTISLVLSGLLDNTIHLFPRKKVMPFKHGQYHQIVLKHLINDTVVSLDQFTDIIA